VFAGGWTLSDAESICSDDSLPTKDVFDVLSELVTKSLVAAEPSLTGATRYGMLETLRAYAGRQLAGAGELERIAGRHLSHFVELAERARLPRSPWNFGDGGPGVMVTQ
jgi:predicted ATPase